QEVPEWAIRWQGGQESRGVSRAGVAAATKSGALSGSRLQAGGNDRQSRSSWAEPRTSEGCAPKSRSAARRASAGSVIHSALSTRNTSATATSGVSSGQAGALEWRRPNQTDSGTREMHGAASTALARRGRRRTSTQWKASAKAASERSASISLTARSGEWDAASATG